MYIIGSDLLSEFSKVAGNNRDQNGLHVETLAFLLGYFDTEVGNVIATDLIFPNQHGQAHKVDDQGNNDK